MNVGVLGSGEVAKALAAGFVKHGHPVMMGTRDLTKLATWVDEHADTSVGSFAEAARFGELLVLAVKGSAAEDVLGLAGADNLAGKPVIDTTNPIADAPPVNGVLRFFTDLDESLMERLQRAYPDARLVKAFNSVGNQLMVDPEFREGKATMFICGNDDGAKEVVTAVLEEFGWGVADMGAVEAARAIEPLCMLWCIPGFLRNEWDHAFALVR
jgi:hypothetical protein